MFDVCRPLRRLFLLLLTSVVAAQGPPTTQISDIVYRADGTPAGGTLLISWPEFTTASGQAVAAGKTSVTLGSGGALSAALVPNANATPENTVYVVVYQLNDGSVKTEYWIVPTTSPTTLAGVRTTLGATSSVSQMATQGYVNAALASKANDAGVVHLGGSETITGAKQFVVAPSLPSPGGANDAANKEYVDNAVQNLGSGSFLSTTGGTMTGALTLSGDPVANNQAATKHYADTGLATKADLISGLVPLHELATGTASSSVCLHGDSTWGACGGGGGGGDVNTVFGRSGSVSAQTGDYTVSQVTGAAPMSSPGFSGTPTAPTPTTGDNSTAIATTAFVKNQTYASLAGGLVPPTELGTGTANGTTCLLGNGTYGSCALLDISGNFPGNASSATQLAQTPAQCNGSFATGVQANGNANCSTADVIQLAETSQSGGVPNYGIFWFDASCHCPKVIDNNGQAVQLGLLNVFNTDANTLEEYNGGAPQTLNIYGTRTDGSNYERMRLGYDTTDSYFFLSADAVGSGTQRGLGFWLQNSLRWVIDSGFNFKPWSDNLKDVGQPTLRLKHIYVGTYADLSGGAEVTEVANAASTGTTLNKLAKLTGSPGTVALTATSDTVGAVGIVVDGAGTTGSAQIARSGQASCVFDGATTAGDYVQISGTAAGDCHDIGASYPASGQVLGRVLSTNAGAGTYTMLLSGSDVPGSGPATIPSVFGRTGAISAQSGDYSVGQVSGAAPVATPAFTGTPTAPTPATGDDSTRLATTAFVAGAQTCAKVIDQAGWNGANSDINAVINAMFNAQGSGACVSLYGLSGTLYGATTQPWSGLGTGFASQIEWPCNLQIVTSTMWVTPAKTPPLIHQCRTANTVQSFLMPCVPTAGNGSGCGPNSYPLMNTNNIAVGWPTLADSSNTGTATFSSGNTVTGATNISSGMAGGWITVGSSPTYYAYIQSVSGTTFTLNANWSSSGGPTGSQTYTVYMPNAIAVFWLGGLGIYNDVFGAELDLKVSCEALANCIGVYTQSAQERSVLRVNVSLDAGIQVNASPGSPLACFMADRTYTGFNSPGGPTHFAMRGSECGKAQNATSTNKYGFILAEYSLWRANYGDGPEGSFEPGSCVGDNGKLFTACLVIDGVGQRLKVVAPHFEYAAKGIWVGPTNTTQGVFLDSPSCANDSGQVCVYFDTHATTGNMAENVAVINSLSNVDLVHDVSNSCGDGTGPPCVYNTSSYGSVLAQYLQPNAGGPNIAGTPTAPTPAVADNSGKLATTGYVKAQGYAPLASPTLTGTPTAPTPAASDNSTKIATTAYVQSQTCPIWFTTPNAASTVNFTTTANKAALWGAVLSCNLSSSQVTYDVATADNTSNTYDVGIVNSAGTVLAHIGPTPGTTFAPSTGWKALNWTTPVTLPAGKYYVALTTSCSSSCAVLEGGNSGTGVTFAGNAIVSVTTGGTLPSSVTAPADAYTASTIPAWSVH